MKKTIILILTIIMMLSTTVSANNLSAVTANSYFLAELSEDNVLTQQGCSVSIAPNEFSKLMTALICMEKFYPGDWLTFKQEPLVFHNEYGNIAGYKTGIKVKVRHHLRNMLLLYSDASATELAIAYSGSVKAFTEEMNKKAKELGMNDTVFASPCGYDQTGISKTTVNDLYILARAVSKDKDIMDVLAMDQFELMFENEEMEMYSSRNHLISKYTYSDYTYSAANGMMVSKNNGTESIIATATKNGSTLIAIIVNSPDDFSIYKDTINLFEHGFKNYYPRKICTAGDIIEQVNVPNGKTPVLHLVTDRDVMTLIPLGYTKEKITTQSQIPEEISAPVTKGQKIGTVEYLYDGKKVATVSLVAENDVKGSPFAYLYNQFFSKVNTLLIIAILLFIIFVIYYKNKSIKKKKAKRARFEELKKM
ncbi:MAG: D-alanyl-D-alanine carboxypeptidase [Clostridia bacterium]|nr:D-alanyl-D-alanine carboxypeptidase [Clostridia bacterium]